MRGDALSGITTQAADLHFDAYEGVLAQSQGHTPLHKQHLRHPVLLAIAHPLRRWRIFKFQQI